MQDVSPTRETEAGKKLSSLIPDQKHTFTRPITVDWTASSASSLPSVQEVGVTTLVSVLDLDNTSLSVAIRLIDRGNSPLNAGFLRSSNRDQHLTRCDQIVLFVTLRLL